MVSETPLGCFGCSVLVTPVRARAFVVQCTSARDRLRQLYRAGGGAVEENEPITIVRGDDTVEASSSTRKGSRLRFH